MRVVSFLFFSSFILLSSAQESNNTPFDYNKYFQLIQESLVPGVEQIGDSVFFSDEARKILGDKKYRESIYKEHYTFTDLSNSLAESNFQKAFWHMINLYPKHKKVIIQYVSAYNLVLPIENLLNAALFTYGIFDPRITNLKDGSIEIYRPDIFEEYIHITEEIMSKTQKEIKTID